MNRIIDFRRSQTSFRSRLFLIFTVFTGLISAVFAFVLITGEVRNNQERSTEKSEMLATLLAGSITLHLYSENMAELYYHAQEMLSTPRVARVRIISSDNRTLVDLESPAIPANAPLVTASAQVTANSSSPSAEAALSGIVRTAATPIGSVSIAIDVSDGREKIRSAIFKTSGMAILFWLAVVSACYPVLKRVTHSFNSLTDGLDSMMGGNFTEKIVVDRDDEAGRAAGAVNRLAAALEERDIENRALQE